MTSSKNGKDLTFGSPVCYHIYVKGFLDESWSERFSGMRISNQSSGRISPMSVLVGTVRDQTELIGVLNNLYEMHLPFISLEIVDDE